MRTPTELIEMLSNVSTKNQYETATHMGAES